MTPTRSEPPESLDDLVVSKDANETAPEEVMDGIGLCLSGGGFRAMLFHIGSLWRLSETGQLAKVARISSVSGGSITAGVLGLAWKELHASGFDQGVFKRMVVGPLRDLADRTIDVRPSFLGIVTPFRTINDYVAKAYKELLGDATLQDLPDDPPRFVFNATNLQSTVLWRFSKPYAWDWKVGQIPRPEIPLTRVVAASSAFPPFLSPATIKVRQEDFAVHPKDELRRPPFTTDPALTDGGVYDNLGLETVWKNYRTVLVSDGGGKTVPKPKVARDWAQLSWRVAMVMDNQVRSLRKRTLIASYKEKQRNGAYWGIRTDITNYELAATLPSPFEQTKELADISTRLKKIDRTTQERLINWGYAVCDAALRAHVDSNYPVPVDFPYPAAGVG
jgi:NTE family protein